MTNIVLVAMNLHEVLLKNGRLPGQKLRGTLANAVPKFIASTGMPAGAKQAGTYDTMMGLTIAYRLRTRVGAVPVGFKWVPIDSPDVTSNDKYIIELVLKTERP